MAKCGMLDLQGSLGLDSEAYVASKLYFALSIVDGEWNGSRCILSLCLCVH